METKTIFDLAEEEGKAIDAGHIEVVFADYNRSETTTYEELFDGFDELYAITYSAGIDFIGKIINKFEYAEIVFGCEATLDNDLAAVMSVEAGIIRRLTKHKSAQALSSLMSDNKLKLFISRDTKSHEKIYCLKSNQGKLRVITGSANMSYSAFFGIQRENILVFDGNAGFQHYFDLYQRFREECSDNVEHAVFQASIENQEYINENVEQIPIIKKAIKEHYVFLNETTDESEALFINEVKGHESELRKILPKPKRQNGANKTLITSDMIPAVKRKHQTYLKDKKQQEHILPKLHVDYVEKTMTFNGKMIDLNPSPELISHDVNCLIEYINSLEKFNGDYSAAQYNYYKFANWYFCSVFMAYMRQIAFLNHYDVIYYPVFGIIYGNSNGGKSTFIRLLNKLMTGNVIQPNASGDFTATEIDRLKQLSEGVPIYIDDLAKQQYANHSEKIIKEDNWGITEKLINYPAVAISTNRLPSITADISKRAITCRINAKISNEEGSKSSKKINDSIRKANNNLFSAYVRIMLDRISTMEEKMKNGATDFPDILQESANVLYELIGQYYMGEIPNYVVKLSYFSYFGNDALGANAIHRLCGIYETEPENFKINEKRNELQFLFHENAYYEMKYIKDELPPQLDAELYPQSLTMNLGEARKVFPYRFRKNIFGRYK